MLRDPADSNENTAAAFDYIFHQSGGAQIALMALAISYGIALYLDRKFEWNLGLFANLFVAGWIWPIITGILYVMFG